VHGRVRREPRVEEQERLAELRRAQLAAQRRGVNCVNIKETINETN